MSETATTVAGVLEKHLPVLIEHNGQVTPAGCACGLDPLDHTEHVAARVAEVLDAPPMHLHLAIDTADKAATLRGWLDEQYPQGGDASATQ